jgi:electron transfer flavoprotein beta subunit
LNRTTICGNYNLVLLGRQAGDWGFGQTGAITAEILRIPFISVARKVRVEGNFVVGERLKRNGYEIVRAAMPAPVTVSSEIGDLRKPPLKAIIEARKKSVTVRDIGELEISHQMDLTWHLSGGYNLLAFR